MKFTMQGTHISSGGNTTGASLLLDLFDDDKIRSRPFMSVQIFSGDIQKFTECLRNNIIFRTVEDVSQEYL